MTYTSHPTAERAISGMTNQEKTKQFALMVHHGCVIQLHANRIVDIANSGQGNRLHCCKPLLTLDQWVCISQHQLFFLNCMKSSLHANIFLITHYLHLHLLIPRDTLRKSSQKWLFYYCQQMEILHLAIHKRLSILMTATTYHCKNKVYSCLTAWWILQLHHIGRVGDNTII